MIETLEIRVPGKGLHDITGEVARVVAGSGVDEGLCTLYIQHTSASLLIQENYDPAVLRDLEHWFDRLVPQGDAIYTHNSEGPDDMPAHIRSALTATSLSIPILNRRPALGSWQGIMLWEHRDRPRTRRVLVHLSS